ncbi:hypothetical protein LNV23_21820 [Paucibacter sp. DJ1R-11]|uniref:hypothetical protein n=1 Tax=Paucibacter sp. DJ1R-11 TaxID=2893556 RepID=UPI0021E402FB|nr:hypothetical protein [Paucibacter sp. DJ1R-11]MCV2366086.1 hypothetical protein [Paucibacter sp. DJ1R-11]
MDVKNGIVYTALGEISKPKYVEPTQERAAIGKWSGYVWRREDGDPGVPTGNAKWISITFGVVKESGKKYINYKANVMKQGQMVLAEDIKLFVDDVHSDSPQGGLP